MRNKVFIAISFDGFIADEHDDVSWLTDMPTPSTGDGGFSKFMESVDAVLMGRKTYEKVISFGIDWPYAKKVFVWTNTLVEIPINLKGKVEFLRGGFEDIMRVLQQRRFSSLYIDGGKTIQSFLRANLIHEIIVTRVPIVLGGGIPFLANSPRVRLRHQSTNVFDNGMVQTHYIVEV